jgi:site-specific recombinase XerD
MLRCGLRVEELANLGVDDLDLRQGRILVKSGKGAKGRVVYISPDAHGALLEYLKKRSAVRTRRLFLVDKGALRGKPISARGIQKRMELYAKRAGIKVSCHHLRHTMATQLLNADADLTVIQDLLGHSRIATTQRYCRVSNLKVQRDYYKAMEVVMKRTSPAD